MNVMDMIDTDAAVCGDGFKRLYVTVGVILLLPPATHTIRNSIAARLNSTVTLNTDTHYYYTKSNTET
jgi:hypothetical protein